MRDPPGGGFRQRPYGADLRLPSAGAGDFRISGAGAATQPQARSRACDLTPQVLDGETVAQHGHLACLRPLLWRRCRFGKQAIGAISAG